jgi:hypothetical protein
MGYFNYHAKAKNLIAEGHLTKYIFGSWNKVENALVLFFDNSKPMPIREHKHSEYLELIQKMKK